LSVRKERINEQLNRWKGEASDPRMTASERDYAKRRFEEVGQELKDFESVSFEGAELKLLESQKQSEKTKKFMSEMNELRAAEKAAEEERLKNVVVPIEIEGGPLPKDIKTMENRYVIQKEGGKFWIIDKLHNEKTIAMNTSKEAREMIKDFVEDDLKKTGPRGIVPKKSEQVFEKKFEPNFIKTGKKDLPEIPSYELNAFVDDELRELQTRDIDNLFEIISENIETGGMSVDRDELYKMLKSKIDPRKKD